MSKKHEISEVGSVGLQRILHKRKRTKGDPLSVGKVTTKHQASKGYRTEGEREGLALSLRQQQHKGSLGGGASRKIKQRRMGIAAGTEMDWTHKLVEQLTEKKDWIQGKDRLER